MLKIANRTIGESVTAKATAQAVVSNSNEPQNAVTSHEYYRDKFEHVQKNKEARDEKSAALFGTIFGGPLIGTRVGEPIVDKTDQKKSDLRDMIEKSSEEIKKLEAELAEVYDSSFVSTSNWFIGRDAGEQEESNVNQVTARKTTRSSTGSDDND